MIAGYNVCAAAAASQRIGEVFTQCFYMGMWNESSLFTVTLGQFWQTL